MCYWITYSAAYRQNKKNCKLINRVGINPEWQLDVPCIADQRQAEPKSRSILQRKIRNKQLQKKNHLITESKKKLASDRQKNKRIKQN
ncbi:hypothetical protein WA026_014151 [Henosepilachna vigintioctopunctata]|uniref:Uncharacterized protein n=1 Tax=Henosepilachna vigintioctopunctata TaxID=420089 RepID=A0AAW1TLU5_9CUCU